MKEVWKDIQGYEGLYQVSNLGKVRSLGNGKSPIGRKPRIMIGNRIRSGYLIIYFWKDGIRKYTC